MTTQPITSVERVRRQTSTLPRREAVRCSCSVLPSPATSTASLRTQLIEHLPHSVSGVGEELARGDPDLEPFYAIGKVKPSELLGFVVVGWMLEGSGQSSDRCAPWIRGFGRCKGYIALSATNMRRQARSGVKSAV